MLVEPRVMFLDLLAVDIALEHLKRWWLRLELRATLPTIWRGLIVHELNVADCLVLAFVDQKHNASISLVIAFEDRDEDLLVALITIICLQLGLRVFYE